MVQRTYYADREPTFADKPIPEHDTTKPGHLRWGYTLADIHSLARLSVHTTGLMGMDWHERHDIAYGAIAEHLYSVQTVPLRNEMVRAGQLALYAVVTDHRHHHGYYKHKTIGASAGPGSSPAFAKFWGSLSLPYPACEPRVVERMALRQIMVTLTARQREALVALAALADYKAAAAHLGIQECTYTSLIARARKEFFALWHEGETPSRRYGIDRRVYRYADQESVEKPPDLPPAPRVTRPDNCIQCKRPMSTALKRKPDEVIHRANGRCRGCVSARKREEGRAQRLAEHFSKAVG